MLPAQYEEVLERLEARSLGSAYEAAVVLNGEGQTLNHIAAELNARDLRTTNGKEWTAVSVCRLLGGHSHRVPRTRRSQRRDDTYLAEAIAHELANSHESREVSRVLRTSRSRSVRSRKESTPRTKGPYLVR